MCNIKKLSFQTNRRTAYKNQNAEQIFYSTIKDSANFFSAVRIFVSRNI